VVWLSHRPLPTPAIDRGEGPLVMDLTSYPYLHHEPDGLIIGSAVLSEYAYSSDTLAAGDTFEIILRWARIAPEVVLQVRLMAMSAHLTGQSVVWAEAYVPIDAPETTVTLQVPSEIPPGVYLLRLGAKLANEGTLSITDAEGTAFGRASLRPVWVRREPTRLDLRKPMAVFGYPEQTPTLSLLSAETWHIKDHSLELRLVWRAEKVPSRNYAVSLRYVRNSGATLKTLDRAPMWPDYPTGLWRPGEVVSTRMQIEVPKKEIAEGDVWQVVLYDRTTLTSIGTATVQVTLAN